MSARIVSYGFLVLGSLCTLAFVIYGADGLSLGAIALTIWALLPYAAFAHATRSARMRGSILAASGASVLAVAAAIGLYTHAFFIHPTPTSAVGFVFVPLYQLLAAFAVRVYAGA